MTIDAYRRPATSDTWSNENTGFDEKGNLPPNISNVEFCGPYHLNKQELSFKFSIASKGGGYTDLLVTVSPDSFEEVMDAMFEVNAEATRAAFAAALEKWEKKAAR
jgi:hypothetical protein